MNNAIEITTTQNFWQKQELTHFNWKSIKVEVAKTMTKNANSVGRNRGYSPLFN